VQPPSALARMIPLPRRREKAHVDLAAPASTVWRFVRHDDLLRTRLLRWSFHAWRWMRLAPSSSMPRRLCIDDLRSTPEQPGARVFSDERPRQFSVGALVQARPMPSRFAHAESIEEFSAFDAPGLVKLAWGAVLVPLAVDETRLHVELRLGANDEAWRSVRWPSACMKPLVHWAHRQLLGSLADDLGWPGRVRARTATGGVALPDFLAPQSR
jgi:hypothetical protein